MCMSAELQTYHIIPLVNEAWTKSFRRVEKNRNDIADIGWNPLNRNTLTFPEICVTIITEEVEDEGDSSEVILPVSAIMNINHQNNDSPSFEPQFLAPALAKPDLNYQTGTASFCIDTIVQHEYLMKAKARIKINRMMRDHCAIKSMCANVCLMVCSLRTVHVELAKT